MRVKLEDVCKRIYAGGDVPKDRYSVDKTDIFNVPIFANAEKDDGLYGYTDEARENELSITVAARGTIGYTAIRREPFLPVVRLITVVPNLSKVSARYLYYVLRNYKPKSSGTSIPQLTVPDIKNNFINIISISEQEKIADRLDKVSKLIELRQKEIAMFDTLIKARFIELFGDPEINPKKWNECA
ncbi:restriction endonuclease subunit S, partial [uncultured Anaerovibrio sp.]|uniref:restriction endonuclease subunit S n=1 Tax=uncultured Anaerovibrio sp. TaxID=361586 RepID=UPI002621DA6D